MRLRAPARHRPASGEHGQALAELALVVSIMLVMALGVFDLGRAYFMSMLLNQAARDGARVAMACDATIAEIQSAALAAAPSGSTVTVSPNPRPACPPTMSTTTTTTVTVNYTHSWMTPFWGGGGSLAMSEAARSR